MHISFRGFGGNGTRQCLGGKRLGSSIQPELARPPVADPILLYVSSNWMTSREVRRVPVFASAVPA